MDHSFPVLPEQPSLRPFSRFSFARRWCESEIHPARARADSISLEARRPCRRARREEATPRSTQPPAEKTHHSKNLLKSLLPAEAKTRLSNAACAARPSSTVPRTSQSCFEACRDPVSALALPNPSLRAARSNESVFPANAILIPPTAACPCSSVDSRRRPQSAAQAWPQTAREFPAFQ